MTCWSVKRRKTDYVDGRLRPGERSRLEAHLQNCDSCDLEINEMRSVRSSLRNLLKPDAPAALRTRLRVIASYERHVLLETNGSRVRRVWNNWKFRINQMMRPLTIPATGGLLSSLLLFGALALTISTTTRAVQYEVPVYYENHIDPNLVPLELRSSVFLTLSLDGSGRITDYAVQQGESKSFVGDPARLQGNNISLPEFPERSRSGDISISFIPVVYRP
ncbi:MAG: zf-HC2 domain-containing protein [Acidobacteriaceae bacterium]|nr:zf-HC2 domain-containing protein [Acidobacteriaceae bacterium]MBV9502648.1 zf-HC2 domain-containing protein [Acidobacteriaceae bacterium]